MPSSRSRSAGRKATSKAQLAAQEEAEHMDAVESAAEKVREAPGG